MFRKLLSRRSQHNRPTKKKPKEGFFYFLFFFAGKVIGEWRQAAEDGGCWRPAADGGDSECLDLELG
jgi:hypothetical protein